MELHLENLVKDFSGTKAVDTGSFSIMDGKLTGLLGRAAVENLRYCI